MPAAPSRLIVIGLDGVMPEFLRRFAAEGVIPNIAGLMDRGAFCEALPSPPCDTPTNWTTLATGTWTGTHGINSFGVHLAGEPFRRLHDVGKNIFPPFASASDENMNELTRVEYFWQAAERAGKRAILVNFPGGWPPNAKTVITVDGSGPYCSRLVRMSYPSLFTTDENPPAGANRLRTCAPHGWLEPPDSARDPRETVFVLTGEADVEPTPAGWMVTKDSDAAGPLDPELLYCCLVLASTRDRYDRLMVCKGRDASRPVAVLREGEWSDWITDEFQTPYGSERRPGKFKFKLVRLSSDAREIALYRTTIFNTQGWAYPDGIADELIEDLFARGEQSGQDRPFESDGTKEDVPRVSPLCQVTESIADQCVGIALVCEALCRTHDWDMLWAQLHAPDGLNHQALNGIYPDSPDYDPEEEEATWERFREEFRNMDAMVGRILDGCADEETLVCAISDHGAIPTTRRVWLGHFLAEAGFIHYMLDEENRIIEMDASKSKVVLGDHPLAQNIWVNLRGRDPDGIVEPGEEYERVRRDVIQLLYSIRDPETGECPVAFAMRKEDCEDLGQWGDNVGDIVYYLAPGYSNDITIHSPGSIALDDLPRNGFGPMTGGMQGVHHAYHPTARLGGCSVRGIFLLAGPGIKEKYWRRRPVRTVDVAPTLARLIGIPAPRDAEGCVVADVRAQ
ncbi:MAG: alkaline phosphatase family protein [Armatimonadota bacterium]